MKDKHFRCCNNGIITSVTGCSESIWYHYGCPEHPQEFFANGEPENATVEELQDIFLWYKDVYAMKPRT